MKVNAIVLAAGSGSRMKSKTKKQFMTIKGKPVIWFALNAFQKSMVDEIILVTSKEDVDYCKNIIKKYKKEGNGGRIISPPFSVKRQ